MGVIIIGLGSMGKRRIRCLQALDAKDLVGFDKREDRCKEAYEKYGVECLTDFEAAWAKAKPSMAIISLPPDLHSIYMKICAERKVPFFVEASVLTEGLAEIDALATKNGIVAAPSATMTFHNGIRTIKSIVDSGRLGKISNILFHSGQYLPDWHPYESVSDFYVSNPLTGGAREILPFELTWLTWIFGVPKRVCANVRKTIDIKGAEKIDDTYNCLLDYGSSLAVVTIDVVSRFATRRLTINGTKMQMQWAWQNHEIKLYDPEKGDWEIIPYESGAAAPGYNKNIGEDMYIEEIRAFIAAVEGKAAWPNSLKDDIQVLTIMEKLEQADRESRYVEV